jgi:hypothetical protein
LKAVDAPAHTVQRAAEPNNLARLTLRHTSRPEKFAANEGAQSDLAPAPLLNQPGGELGIERLAGIRYGFERHDLAQAFPQFRRKLARTMRWTRLRAGEGVIPCQAREAIGHRLLDQKFEPAESNGVLIEKALPVILGAGGSNPRVQTDDVFQGRKQTFCDAHQIESGRRSLRNCGAPRPGRWAGKKKSARLAGS